jgi:hypothetical protein
MTIKGLIKHLQAFPLNTEVMVERGEWGPCRIKDGPRIAIVQDKGTTENWEATGYEDYDTTTAVII